MKKLFVCTPRMLVIQISHANDVVRYWDVGPDDRPYKGWRGYVDGTFVNRDGDVFEAQYIRRYASTLPMFHAEDVYEARVDARAAQAHDEVQRTIRNMLRGVRYRG